MAVEEKKNNTASCEECRKEVAKYKCPCCEIRTCSLSCVRAHKDRTSCSGKRDRTAFVPIASFDNNHLLSDYNLLEEVLRHSQSAKRFRAPFNSISRNPTGRWQLLQVQAKRRNISLVYLPKGMTKRIENSSRYCRRLKCIFWRVEWKFHSTDLTLVTASADENESPAKILERQLNRHNSFKTECMRKIKKVCEKPIESMRFLLAKERCPGGPRRFVELDPVEPLGAQLDCSVIIEYPTILVVSPSSDTEFRIIQDLRANKSNGEANMVEAEGVPYKEEEIEEGEIID